MPKPKPGTGPKPTVVPPPRYSDGHVQPQRDTARGKAPTLVRRIMDHASLMGLDKRVATELGRLTLQGVLTEFEMAAGLVYAEVAGEYERVKGYPRRSCKSPSYDEGFRGGDALDLAALKRMDPEAAEKVEAKIKRRIRRLEKRYADAQACMPGPCDRDLDSGLGVSGGRNLTSTVVEEVCCNDRPVNSSHHPVLKLTLRLLGEKFKLRVTDHDERQSRRRKPQSGDAAILAQAAVDALEEWFRKRSATIQFFRVERGQSWQARRISGYGATVTGADITYSIKIPRSGIMAEAIDAQLLKAAIAKGWNEAPQAVVEKTQTKKGKAAA